MAGETAHAQAEAEWLRLAMEGHAVLLDTVRDPDGKVAQVRVHHYKTCSCCLEEKQGGTV